jgi:geranylgeranyl pyrophosphate synthase
MGSGKCLRSCLAYDTYTALCPGTSKDYSLSVGKVSATLEILQAFFLINDDVVDHGTMRHSLFFIFINLYFVLEEISLAGTDYQE